MSGGSFDYYYHKFDQGIIDKSVIEAMMYSVKRHGHPVIGEYLKSFLEDYKKVLDKYPKMASLLKAIEFYVSNDYTASTMYKALDIPYEKDD